MSLGKAFRRIMGIPDPQPPAPIDDRRGWSEDWQVGDLARCVYDNWHFKEVSDPKIGDILRVSDLSEGQARGADFIASFLLFEGKPQNKSWHNSAFAKIRPDHSADEIETGIIEKIKKGAMV